MDRKTFMQKTTGGIILGALLPFTTYSQEQQLPKPLDIQLVKDFVVAGHRSLQTVKEMLEEHPYLIHTSYDWGKGDYEQAIEGAGHLGKKEIANFLIEQGARLNLFVLTMLGKTELVKPVLETYPKLIFSKGPHGFSLLHHAKVGEAKELHDYLTAKGLNTYNLGKN
ncbi:hypothetical protein [Flagellimonas meridianipacifica]|uniref:Ankyrin repeat protein n=1 Tax=Flagellimonas meridianipacifica TaxID=1080225 RepID=A0A2T0MBP6_9FLAO|nr:hypothetical protein [Allomuricauda pacifica]PRX54919.1 hypothetical protein CLV81_3324 [Allomuricauda pacifica]